MMKITKTLLLSAAFLVSLTGITEARDYLVEVVIFERLPDPGEIEDQNQPTDEDIIEMEDTFQGEIQVSDRIAAKYSRIQDLSIQSAEFETEPQLENLRAVSQNLSSSGYRVLKTARWIQPPDVYQDAPLVPLGSPETELPHAYIRVYRTTLIFADIDIQLSPLDELVIVNSSTAVLQDSSNESDVLLPDTTLPESFFLSEKRRLKFKEIHYFDHPRIGVIMGVWPVETQEKSEEES